jgi:hypothetical protein
MTQERWVLMKDSIELGPYARPLIMGPDAQPIPLKSVAMTEAPLVPNRARSWLNQRSPSATCALGGAQPKGRQPKHHLCARCAQHWGRSPSATCALGGARHWGIAQAPRVHRGCAQPPGRSPSTTCPHMVFLWL